ncbi:hypothetical protein PMAYCL1PPCAC_01728, partial [Pristionchus mayeri]
DRFSPLYTMDDSRNSTPPDYVEDLQMFSDLLAALHGNDDYDVREKAASSLRKILERADAQFLLDNYGKTIGNLLTALRKGPR